MGVFDGIIIAVKKELGRSVEQKVEQKVYEAVAPKATEAMNKQAAEVNAAAQNLAAANANLADGASENTPKEADIGMAIAAKSLEAMKNLKFCEMCKQPCDVSATVCPVCGATSFKSAMQLAEEEEA